MISNDSYASDSDFNDDIDSKEDSNGLSIKCVIISSTIAILVLVAIGGSLLLCHTKGMIGSSNKTHNLNQPIPEEIESNSNNSNSSLSESETATAETVEDSSMHDFEKPMRSISSKVPKDKKHAHRSYYESEEFDYPESDSKQDRRRSRDRNIISSKSSSTSSNSHDSYRRRRSDSDSDSKLNSSRRPQSKSFTSSEIQSVDNLLSSLKKEISSLENDLASELQLQPNGNTTHQRYKRDAMEKIRYAKDARVALETVESDLEKKGIKKNINRSFNYQLYQNLFGTTTSNVNDKDGKSTVSHDLKSIRSVIVFSLVAILLLALLLFFCYCKTPEALELRTWSQNANPITNNNIAQVVPINVALENTEEGRTANGWTNWTGAPRDNGQATNVGINRNQFSCLSKFIGVVLVLVILTLLISHVGPASVKAAETSKQFQTKRLAEGLNLLQRDYDLARDLRKDMNSSKSRYNGSSLEELRGNYDTLGKRYPDIITGNYHNLEKRNNDRYASDTYRSNNDRKLNSTYSDSNSSDSRKSPLSYDSWNDPSLPPRFQRPVILGSSTDNVRLSLNNRIANPNNSKNNFKFQQRRKKFNIFRFSLYLLIFIVSLSFYFTACSGCITFFTHTFVSATGIRHNFTFNENADGNTSINGPINVKDPDINITWNPPPEIVGIGLIRLPEQFNMNIKKGEEKKLFFFKEIDGHYVGTNIERGKGGVGIFNWIKIISMIVALISLGLMIIEIGYWMHANGKIQVQSKTA